MAYCRWDGNKDSLYVWQGFDGLHIWKPGQGDEEGIVFKNGENLKCAEALFHALSDHLQSNGIKIKFRAGELTTKKAKKCRT